MIQIYSPENKDYEHNGDMTLMPEEAEIHVILNGEWTATIEHPIDDEGRWKYITDNAVVKMPSFNGEQLFRIQNKEKSDSGLLFGGCATDREKRSRGTGYHDSSE